MAAIGTRVREGAGRFLRIVRSFDQRDWLEVLFLTAVTVCGVLARIKMFPYQSGDMNSFLIHWYDYLKENGGFAAVGDEIGDYPPMYYYFLAALTYTDIPVVTGIKLFSCIFDLIGAFYIKRILDINYRKTLRPLIGYAAAFLLPEAIFNSASWGQCDGIFTCFIIITLYQFLRGKDLRAMVFFGVAISFKLQAIFLIPFILMMVMKKRIRLRTLPVIPAVYLLSILPGVLAGGDFKRLLTLYLHQAGEYSQINLSLPNVWALFDSVGEETIGAGGVYIAAGGIMIVMYYCLYADPHPEKLTVRGAIVLAALSCFTAPYLIPHMHERYYYCADMMILLVALSFPKRFWILLTSQFCIIIAMNGFLFSKPPMDMRLLTLIETVNLVVVFFCLREEFRSPQGRDVVMQFEAKKAIPAALPPEEPAAETAE